MLVVDQLESEIMHAKMRDDFLNNTNNSSFHFDLIAYKIKLIFP